MTNFQDKTTLPELKMQYQGSLIQHLGFRMYTNTVSAIAELISNAWDAEAEQVTINIPEGNMDENSIIEIIDDGHGMTPEEVNTEYLMLGRNRRTNSIKSRTKKRIVIGKKGIGKLAGFGIAEKVSVTTISKGWELQFEMDYSGIVDPSNGVTSNYKPIVLRYEQTDKQSGTIIELKKLKKKVAGKAIENGLKRIFSIFDEVKVVVNGIQIKKSNIECQIRSPDEGWEETTLPGTEYKIKWWVGFTKETIDESNRGVSVLANKKLVQRPTQFGLSMSGHAMFGMSYMTGEIVADYLDNDTTTAEDIIATNRQEVVWEHPKADHLKTWATNKINELLRRWNIERTKKNEEAVFKYITKETLDSFNPRERHTITSMVKTLAKNPTLKESHVKEISGYLLEGFEDKNFKDLLSEISELEPNNPDYFSKLMNLFKEWDLLEAVKTYQIVSGKLKIIDQFKNLIARNANEVPTLHNFIKDNPWLLGPRYETMQHEKKLDKLIIDKFKLEVASDKKPRKKKKRGKKTESNKRVDFICLSENERVLVVEIKKPDVSMGKKEIRQLEDYVIFLNTYYRKESGSRKTVYGQLIGGKISNDDTVLELIDRVEGQGIKVFRWDSFIKSIVISYREFLEICMRKAPKDDARIKALEEM